jgi:hypothetical protein
MFYPENKHSLVATPPLSSIVLAKYQLIEFVSLVDSIRKGDLRTFNDVLIKYQHRFIRYV